MELNAAARAIVSGGASGMGEATVRALRAAGVGVAILDRSVDRGRAVANETGAHFFEADVMDEASTLAAFAAARAAQGQEHILVHTPGGGGMGRTAWRDDAADGAGDGAGDGAIRRHDFDHFSRIVALNLNATFLCASIAASGMMTLAPDAQGQRGVIIMTSSTASQDGPVATTAYVAAKAGVNGMTLSMARDLAPEGIRVNTIVPGTFDTPLMSEVSEEYLDEMRAWNLMPPRLGRAEEYASFALELIRNRFINAAVMRIDAGSRS